MFPGFIQFIPPPIEDGGILAVYVKTSLPIMVTFVVLGIGYGLLMEKSGYGPLWSLASGLIIFSGTVQFVSVTMLGSGSVLTIARGKIEPKEAAESKGLTETDMKEGDADA